MKKRSFALWGSAVLLVVSVAPAFADELIRFKSGYEMMVVSHREERGMIIVTLDGGGELGFPKDLLESLEEGKPTQRVGPSPGYNRLPSRASGSEKFKAPLSNDQTRTLARAAYLPHGVRMGYSMHGEEQVRFSAGATGKGATDRAKEHLGPQSEGRSPEEIRKRQINAKMPTINADVDEPE